MGRVVRIRLDNLLKEKGLTQRQLKDQIDPLYREKIKNKPEYKNNPEKLEKVGFRAAAISEIYNNQRKTINREHLELIADALEIDDISELIEIENIN